MSDQSWKQGGLEQRYCISKMNGEPTESGADYFVLRLDTDPHARTAAMQYAESVSFENPMLAMDLIRRMYWHEVTARREAESGILKQANRQPMAQP